ncbi:hypothetical protein CesoFtcFv8_002119 [Champsocephalus esox]|uniref:Uncharacterized protein n=1 Tax=Champsocephalus esox TaxID=159716 RepID=A0AAN8CXB4_9TELE|nr:hypothetical protein CesoFtcFv8_002119 [Champsocephalus esox]
METPASPPLPRDEGHRGVCWRLLPVPALHRDPDSSAVWRPLPGRPPCALWVPDSPASSGGRGEGCNASGQNTVIPATGQQMETPASPPLPRDTGGLLEATAGSCAPPGP